MVRSLGLLIVLALLFNGVRLFKRFAVVLLIVCVCGGCVASVAPPPLTSLQDWVDLDTFTPLVLWPEPNGSKLLGPPRREVFRSHEFVWIWYSEDFIASGIEPPGYMLYEGDIDTLIGRAFLSDYEVSKVTVARTSLSLHGETVSLEIRQNPKMPDSGVVLFRFRETSVAYNWRHMTLANALGVLERNLRPVYPHDTDLISLFDGALARYGY